MLPHNTRFLVAVQGCCHPFKGSFSGIQRPRRRRHAELSWPFAFLQAHLGSAVGCPPPPLLERWNEVHRPDMEILPWQLISNAESCLRPSRTRANEHTRGKFLECSPNSKQCSQVLHAHFCSVAPRFYCECVHIQTMHNTINSMTPCDCDRGGMSSSPFLVRWCSSMIILVTQSGGCSLQWSCLRYSSWVLTEQPLQGQLFPHIGILGISSARKLLISIDPVPEALFRCS